MQKDLLSFGRQPTLFKTNPTFSTSSPPSGCCHKDLSRAGIASKACNLEYLPGVEAGIVGC